MRSHVKNRFWHYILPLVLMVVCLLPVSKALAAENSLSLNGSWAAGEIMVKDDIDYYTFMVTQAGFVTIEYQGLSIGDSWVKILNNDMTESYENHNVWGSAATNPKSCVMVMALEAGAYKVQVGGTWGCFGTYRVKGTFKAANNNEKEPNNLFEDAMELNAKKMITGFLSRTDQVDFYKFTVPSRQRIAVTYTGLNGNSKYTVYDSELHEIKNVSVWGASESNPQTSPYEDMFDAGTYYIRITPYSGDTGRYKLSWDGVKVKLGIGNVSLATDSYTYTGKAVKPSVTVTSDGITLKKGSDYTVSYSNNSKVGVGKVTVKGTGSYTGTVTRTFNIYLGQGKTFTKSNYTYKITSNATVALTKVKGTVSSITVPATVTYGGVKLKVTSIGNKACQGGKATKVTIGKNVTSIGTRAFYKCSKLKTITIQSKNLRSAGKDCFKGISKNAKIKVPSSKYKYYSTLLAKKGQAKSVKIKK